MASMLKQKLNKALILRFVLFCPIEAIQLTVFQNFTGQSGTSKTSQDQSGTNQGTSQDRSGMNQIIPKPHRIEEG